MAATVVMLKRTKLHHLNGKVFKDEGLPSVKVPAKCLAPSEGTEIPREVYVKLIFHEVVTAGSNYTMSKQTKHIQKLLGILAKLEKAKPREQPSLKVYSKSTQADIGRQIPVVTVNSTDVSEIDLGCSMFCTIPNETSVYATPYVGAYKVPVVVEGDQACLQLGRLTVFAEAHGQLISHLLKMFPLKKLSCLQELNDNTFAVHFLLADAPILAVVDPTVRLRPVSARTVGLHNSAVALLNAAEDLETIDEEEVDEFAAEDAICSKDQNDEGLTDAAAHEDMAEAGLDPAAMPSDLVDNDNKDQEAHRADAAAPADASQQHTGPDAPKKKPGVVSELAVMLQRLAQPKPDDQHMVLQQGATPAVGLHTTVAVAGSSTASGSSYSSGGGDRL